MLKPFVIYSENKKVTKIEEFSSDTAARDAVEKVLDSDNEAESAFLVYALSKKDLERDPAHRVGATLDTDSDGMTIDLRKD